ncbi:hypothetical protein D3C73_1403030 [compost metagenome]
MEIANEIQRPAGNAIGLGRPLGLRQFLQPSGDTAVDRYPTEYWPDRQYDSDHCG